MTTVRCTGTVSRGVRCPIIREGDDMKKIAVDSLLTASKTDNFEIRDKDVLALTESIVARSQGNYCSIDDIATDVKEKIKDGEAGIIFPILSYK